MRASTIDMKNRYIRLVFVGAMLLTASFAHAQVGEYRNDLSVGVNGGYVMSQVGFTPKVNQKWLGGMTGGLSIRYKSEKYFSTICSIVAEVNYSQVGWKEDILDVNDKPVINATTGVAEEYSRTLSYVQVPVFAHLAWGRETRGAQFFINLGPQFGWLLSERTQVNFDFASRNTKDRVSSVVAQDTMAVEHSFDYGIAAGAGLEYSIPAVGHFALEARYYFGLGNLYGASKKDYFAKSNLSNVVVKMTYWFDIVKTKKNKNKK